MQEALIGPAAANARRSGWPGQCRLLTGMLGTDGTAIAGQAARVTPVVGACLAAQRGVQGLAVEDEEIGAWEGFAEIDQSIGCGGGPRPILGSRHEVQR